MYMVCDSGTTEPEAPYGIVTLASSGSEGGPNMGAMRLAQTAGYGVYVLLCFIPGANRLMQWIALQPRCYTTHSLACCHVYSAEVCMIQSIPKQSSGLPCMMHVHTLLDYGRTIQSLALTPIALTLHWKRCRLQIPLQNHRIAQLIFHALREVCRVICTSDGVPAAAAHAGSQISGFPFVPALQDSDDRLAW